MFNHQVMKNNSNTVHETNSNQPYTEWQQSLPFIKNKLTKEELGVRGQGLGPKP